MGLEPASYQVTARSVSRAWSAWWSAEDDRSTKGHMAGVNEGQPSSQNHRPESSQCKSKGALTKAPPCGSK